MSEANSFQVTPYAAEVGWRSLTVADPIRAHVVAFLSELDVCETTRADYAAELARFLDWNAGAVVEPDTLRRYRDALLARGLSPLSVGTYLTAPRRYFQWLHDRGIAPGVPTVKRPRVARGHRRDTLPPEDLRSALEAVDTGSLVGLRDYALLVLLSHVGLRTVEIERAAVGDLRPAGDTTALYVQGKGHADKDEPVFLEPVVLAPLRHYLRERARLEKITNLPDDAPLFAVHGRRGRGTGITRRTIRHIVAQRLEAVGVKTARLTAHSLRHTAATMALKGGADLVQVQAMLRHADVRTTMIYTHNIERQEKRAERHVDYGLPSFKPRGVAEVAAAEKRIEAERRNLDGLKKHRARVAAKITRTRKMGNLSPSVEETVRGMERTRATLDAAIAKSRDAMDRMEGGSQTAEITDNAA